MENIKLNQLKKSFLKNLHLSTVDNPDDYLFNEGKEGTKRIKVALLSDSPFAKAIEYETDLYYLTEKNSRYIAKYGEIDFVIITSFWCSCEGSLSLSKTSQSEVNAKIKRIINDFNVFNIPVVFWFKDGDEVSKKFFSSASDASIVYSSCEHVVANSNLNIPVKYAFPCVQEKVYNPYLKYLGYEYKGSQVTFVVESYGKSIKCETIYQVLPNIQNSKIYICDSSNLMLKQHSTLPEGLIHESSIVENLGSIDFYKRIEVLKRSDVVLFFDDEKLDETELYWNLVEVTASGSVPLVLSGRKLSDLSLKLCIQVQNVDDLILEVFRINEDDLYLSRLKQILWRNSLSKQTFEARINEFCGDVGLSYKVDREPKVSLIMPTIRYENIVRAVNQYWSISYDNKELIIVCNNNEMPSEDICSYVSNDTSISIKHAPSAMNAGGVMNVGIAESTGEYVFRYDDDDLYGEHYIQDMVLHARSIGADLFGKAPCPLQIEGEEGVYIKSNRSTLKLIDYESLIGRSVWLGGNTVSGKRSFFCDNPYPDWLLDAADTGLQLNLQNGRSSRIAVMDSFNVVAERRKDITSHTWKTDPNKIKRNRRYIHNLYDVFV